jgi:flagellar biosynthesis protein FlhB
LLVPLKVETGLTAHRRRFTDPDVRAVPQRRHHRHNPYTLPVLAALMAAGVLGSVVVSGWSFSPGALQLKWSAINPALVIGNAMNPRSLVRLLASVAKLCFVSLIVWLYLRDKLEAMAVLRWAWSTQIMAEIARIIFGLCSRHRCAITGWPRRYRNGSTSRS